MHGLFYVACCAALFVSTGVFSAEHSETAGSRLSCRFALDYSCSDFTMPLKLNEYLSQVMRWEGSFAHPGVGYDEASGYSYDGHPLDYSTGELYGEPHLFSAPSKESIHVAILALAISGNDLALEFTGGLASAVEVLALKMKGYLAFNSTYPGFGCFTPWVGFDSVTGTFNPLDSWSKPYYKIPGLDNGEWFWSLYAAAHALEQLAAADTQYRGLAGQYRDFVNCQKANAKMIFYRGDGVVSATVYILDGSVAPFPANYIAADGDVLNDPYEGETMTQLLFLFSEWKSEAERQLLWIKKRDLLQAVNYIIPAALLSSTGGQDAVVTVQKGFWFSTHEQWKLMLLPYLSEDLPLVQKIFTNCEKVRTWDAYINRLPGLMASINDVTNGSQTIPDYASACGVGGDISFQSVERRDLMTPYASFGLFLVNSSVGLCWYNNMLQAPRMQSKYGSTEAINANGTEISPLTTWDSKITTVLAMLGGISSITAVALKNEVDLLYDTSYERFVHVVRREHDLAFGGLDTVLGGDVEFKIPGASVPTDSLTDWTLEC